jgi:hypothetical protein
MIVIIIKIKLRKEEIKYLHLCMYVFSVKGNFVRGLSQLIEKYYHHLKKKNNNLIS